LLCDVDGVQVGATIDRIRRKYRRLRFALDERARRLWAGTEAKELGWGGVTTVAQATGLSRMTVRAGMVELRTAGRSRGKKAPAAERIRRRGGGRKTLSEHDSQLAGALEAPQDVGVGIGAGGPVLVA
jgi:hypothetical protein